MGRSIAALLLLLAALAGFARDVLSEREFAEGYIEAIRGKVPAAEIELVDGLHLQIRSPDAKTVTVYLDNAYRAYVQDPGTLNDVIDTYTASAVQSLGSVSGHVDVARIVPVVKDRGWLRDIQSTLTDRGAEEIPEYAYVPLNDELIVVYAEDTPTNIRYLPKRSLEALGIPSGELGPAAIGNLMGLLPGVEALGGDGLYIVAAGGTYEASLLLHDALWTHENFPVEGDFVVGLPTRDLLLVTGSADEEKLQKMRDLVQEAYAEGIYTLSPRLFVRRTGRWVVYE